MSGLGAPAAWVQGAREITKEEALLTWQELLYRRLRGEFHLVPPGEATAAAEDALGLARSTYFYVARPHPKFGEHTVAFAPEHLAPGEVAPFDTGGLVEDHVVTAPPLDLPAKQALVARHSYDSAIYSGQMDPWIQSAFGDVEGYIDGERPAKSFVKEVDLAACTVQAWMWEARIEVPPGFTAAPTFPMRAFISAGKLGHYLEWLRAERILEDRPLDDHLDLVASIVEEVDSPVSAMTNYLKDLP